MKHFLLAGWLFCLCIFLVPVSAQDLKPVPEAKTPLADTPYITVVGQSEVEAQPDILVWHITVTTTNLALAQSKEQHDTALAYVKTLVDENKAKLDRVSIHPMSINKHEKYGPRSIGESQQPVNYYDCSTTVTFRLKDLSLYTTLVTRLSEKPNINFSSSYDCSEVDEKRKEARKAALLDARQKAQEMAETLGLKVGKTLRISETPGRERPMIFNAMAMDRASAGAAAQTVSLEGSMEYNGVVEVVFELIN